MRCRAEWRILLPLRGESALCGEFAQEVASSTALTGQRDFSGLLTWGIRVSTHNSGEKWAPVTS